MKIATDPAFTPACRRPYCEAKADGLLIAPADWCAHYCEPHANACLSEYSALAADFPECEGWQFVRYSEQPHAKSAP